jgi:hypothetical protein
MPGMGAPTGKISRRAHIINSYLFLLSKNTSSQINLCQTQQRGMIAAIMMLGDTTKAPTDIHTPTAKGKATIV